MTEHYAELTNAEIHSLHNVEGETAIAKPHANKEKMCQCDACLKHRDSVEDR